MCVANVLCLCFLCSSCWRGQGPAPSSSPSSWTFCCMNSVVESWVFERTLNIIIHSVRVMSPYPPSPQCLNLSVLISVISIQLWHLSIYWDTRGQWPLFWMPPDQGRQTFPPAALQREVVSALLEEKGASQYPQKLKNWCVLESVSLSSH